MLCFCLDATLGCAPLIGTLGVALEVEAEFVGKGGTFFFLFFCSLCFGLYYHYFHDLHDNIPLANGL